MNYCEALEYFRSIQDRLPCCAEGEIVTPPPPPGGGPGPVPKLKGPPITDDEAKPCECTDLELWRAVRANIRPIGARGLTSTRARLLEIAGAGITPLVSANPTRRMFACFTNSSQWVPVVMPDQQEITNLPGLTIGTMPCFICTEETWGAFVQLSWGFAAQAGLLSPVLVWEEFYLSDLPERPK